MHPAFSVIVLTTASGAAQGLVVVLALLWLAGAPVTGAYVGAGLVLAFVLLLVGLVASFFHLGRPERFWRTATMWRTSWLSREVIVLPAFMASVALWWWLNRAGHGEAATRAAAVLALLLAFALWWCTGMIYACIRFIREWAHPLTLLNYTLIGLAGGVLLAAALAHWQQDRPLALYLAHWGFGLTVLAGLARWSALWRNDRLKPVSTLQSATGIRATVLRQISMGMTGGAFNTREFFHGMRPALFRLIRPAFLLLAFVLPALGLWVAIAWRDPAALTAVLLVHGLGVVAERWFFFAQARHPQNLYYQTVS